MLDTPPLEIPLFTENVIPHMLAWRRAGIASALVTLVNVEGSSPRRVGSQMAVNAESDHVGYISSGCAEAAIIAEAVATIASGEPRTVRYGARSKYIDVVLPCGSGIDLVFDPVISDTVLEALASRIAARRPAALTIDLAGRQPATLVDSADPSALAKEEHFIRRYSPATRIIVAGRGVHVDFVARLARELEWNVIVASPDLVVLARLSEIAHAIHHLTRPEDFDASEIDPYSAVVLLFHDHHWEPALLEKCAAAPAFYVGALGSRRTHIQRKLLLAARGCDPGFIDRIRGPAGLVLDAKNPAEIALAIVAEILSLSPRA